MGQGGIDPKVDAVRVVCRLTDCCRENAELLVARLSPDGVAFLAGMSPRVELMRGQVLDLLARVAVQITEPCLPDPP